MFSVPVGHDNVPFVVGFNYIPKLCQKNARTICVVTSESRQKLIAMLKAYDAVPCASEDHFTKGWLSADMFRLS